MTPDPLGAAAAMQAMYTGKVARSLSDITRAERESLIPDMQKSVLKAPMEAIKLHFMIEGVTRAFTHQMVRQRTAVFAQESMRFAVVGEQQDIPVEIPPSIAQGRTWRQARNQMLDAHPGLNSDHARKMIIEGASEADLARWKWDEAQAAIQDAYQYLVNKGIPAEDARGLLPTNVKTRLNYVTDLRNLQGAAAVRLSTQAQFEWKAVIAAMARAIREYNPYDQLVKASASGWPDSETMVAKDFIAWMQDSERWQYEAISNLFRPICYQTGKCEFMGSADRSCTIRSRVQAFHANNVPSEFWHDAVKYTDEDGPHLIEDADGAPLQPIHPSEWLNDPTAAR